MVANDADRGTATAVRFGSGPAAYDPDDMFGVRRAIHAVTPDARDRFFDRWVDLTEACDFDLRRILTAVREERRHPGAGASGFGVAWRTVDEAMTAYLGWRAVR
jgi:hypothetical protein